MPRQPITDLTTYANKPATTLQERFADWIIEEVGVVFSTQKEMTAFRDGVRLSKALIMRYQASDANKEATAAEKAERESAAPAEEAPKPAKKAAPAKAAPAAKPVPAKAAPAAKRGRKPAAAATADPTTDAPF
jgi:cytoskeletal protein RodZ